MFNILHGESVITQTLSVTNFIKINQHSGVFWGHGIDLPPIFNNRNFVSLLDALMIKVNKDHLRFMQIC